MEGLDRIGLGNRAEETLIQLKDTIETLQNAFSRLYDHGDQFGGDLMEECPAAPFEGLDALQRVVGGIGGDVLEVCLPYRNIDVEQSNRNVPSESISLEI